MRPTLPLKPVLIVCTLALLGAIPMAALAKQAAPVTCSCLPADVDTRIADADRIYVGTVRSIEVVESMVEPGRKDPPVIVTFDVDEAFKDSGKKEELHTSLTRLTCAGFPFEEGKTYLVYAYKRLASTYEKWSLYDYKTGTLGTGGLCGGTQEIDKLEVGRDSTNAEVNKLRALKASDDSRLLPRKPEL